jgi:hypothetical protein
MKTRQQWAVNLIVMRGAIAIIEVSVVVTFCKILFIILLVNFLMKYVYTSILKYDN